MFSLNYRDFLSGYVLEEFDSLIAQLKAKLSVSLNEDGSLRGLDLGLTSVPIGAVTEYAGATAPRGWLFCTGDAVSRVTYKSLFEAIGTQFGAGDGSTTFNLPDMRGRFPLGKAASGTGSALGETGGAIDHTHAGGSHTHVIGAQGDHSHSITSDPDHTHTGTTQGASAFGAIFVDKNLDGTTVSVDPAGHVHAFTTSAAGGHAHGGVTGDAGTHDHGGATGSASGTTGAANPPFLSWNYIILAGA